MTTGVNTDALVARMSRVHTIRCRWNDMAQQKTRPMTLRMPEPTHDALDAVAAALGLDRSSCIRFLVHEKQRVLGLKSPSAGACAAPPDEPPEPKLEPQRAAKKRRAKH
jgi:hypothetical protein